MPDESSARADSVPAPAPSRRQKAASRPSCRCNGARDPYDPSNPFRLRLTAGAPVFALHADGGYFLWSVWGAWRDCKAGEAPVAWGAADSRRSAVREARRHLATAVRVDDVFARRWVYPPPVALWHSVSDGRGGLRSCNHGVASQDGEWLWYRACCGGGETLERIAATKLRREGTAPGACLVELLPGLIQRATVLFIAARPPATSTRPAKDAGAAPTRA